MPTSEEMKQIGRMWNTLIPVNNDRGLIATHPTNVTQRNRTSVDWTAPVNTSTDNIHGGEEPDGSNMHQVRLVDYTRVPNSSDEHGQELWQLRLQEVPIDA